MGELPNAQVPAGVDRLEGAFGVDANAGDTSGGDVLFKGEVLGENTKVLDLIFGIQSLNEVGFLEILTSGGLIANKQTSQINPLILMDFAYLNMLKSSCCRLELPSS